MGTLGLLTLVLVLASATYAQDITVCQPACEPGMPIVVCNMRLRPVPAQAPTPDSYVHCLNLAVPTAIPTATVAAGVATPTIGPTSTPTTDPTCGAGACRLVVPDGLVKPGVWRALVGWSKLDLWSDASNVLVRTPTPMVPPALR